MQSLLWTVPGTICDQLGEHATNEFIGKNGRQTKKFIYRILMLYARQKEAIARQYLDAKRKLHEAMDDEDKANEK